MRLLTTERVAVASLVVLVLLLPFEPPDPALPLLGVRFTLLEGLAAAVMALLLWSHRDRFGPLLRSPPAPLAFLAAFAAANLLSAALAPANRTLAAIFSLRVVAAAAFAALVAVTPPRALRVAFGAMAASGCVVAALAVVEGAGFWEIDPFLDVLRANRSVLANVRRASGGTDNPNLAAAFLVHGLVAATGLAAPRARPLGFLAPQALLISAGLAFTYSRGGLLAGFLALGTLAWGLSHGDRPKRLAPATALAVLACVTAAFAWKGPLFWARWETEAKELGYSARYDATDGLLWLRPGERRTIAVCVTNDGRREWSPDSEPAVHHTWYDIERKRMLPGGEVGLRRGAIPGEALTVTTIVRAPDEEGSYLLVWDLSTRAVGPFSRLGVVPAQVPASVGGGHVTAPGFALPPAYWRRGRLVLWELAVAMWRAHPLTGAGPDNFRRLHGSYGGWEAWNVLHPSNNTFLEAAATTGTLGLLALVATLASTALSALRRLRAPVAAEGDLVRAAILLALTAGLAAHGLVDYFLGFTGYYLFLGLVVGLVSALERFGTLEG